MKNPLEAAKLEGLKGFLAKYNGKLVHPTGSIDDGFEVELTKGLLLTVQPDNLRIVPNFAAAASGQKRRGSVLVSVDVHSVIKGMTAQLKKALEKSCATTKTGSIQKRMRESIRSYPAECSAMTVEQFKASLSFNGISMNDNEASLMWSGFAQSTITAAELIEFSDTWWAAASSGGKSRRALLDKQGNALDGENKRLRRRRIEERSRIKPILTKLVNITQLLFQQMADAKSGGDIEKAFAKMDIDHNGSLDKTELYLALTHDGTMKLTLHHFDVMWPLLDTDMGGAITSREFLAFMMMNADNLSVNHRTVDTSGEGGYSGARQHLEELVAFFTAEEQVTPFCTPDDSNAAARRPSAGHTALPLPTATASGGLEAEVGTTPNAAGANEWQRASRAAAHKAKRERQSKRQERKRREDERAQEQDRQLKQAFYRIPTRGMGSSASAPRFGAISGIGSVLRAARSGVDISHSSTGGHSTKGGRKPQRRSVVEAMRQHQHR